MNWPSHTWFAMASRVRRTKACMALAGLCMHRSRGNSPSHTWFAMASGARRTKLCIRLHLAPAGQVVHRGCSRHSWPSHTWFAMESGARRTKLCIRLLHSAPAVQAVHRRGRRHKWASHTCFAMAPREIRTKIYIRERVWLMVATVSVVRAWVADAKEQVVVAPGMVAKVVAMAMVIAKSIRVQGSHGAQLSQWSGCRDSNGPYRRQNGCRMDTALPPRSRPRSATVAR